MTDHGVSIIKRLSWIVNVLFHQIVAVIVVYVLSVIFTHYPIDSLATWHVVLVTLGYVFLAMEGLVVFMGNNVPTLYISRLRKQPVHAALLLLGTISITVGIALKIYSKSDNHFTSNHAILGLTSWILILCSIFLGIFASKGQALKNFISPVLLKLIHNVVGVLAIILGVSCFCLGMDKGSFKLFSTADTVTAATVTVALCAAWAFVGPIKSAYTQIRSVLNR